MMRSCSLHQTATFSVHWDGLQPTEVEIRVSILNSEAMVDWVQVLYHSFQMYLISAYFCIDFCACSCGTQETNLTREERKQGGTSSCRLAPSPARRKQTGCHFQRVTFSVVLVAIIRSCHRSPPLHLLISTLHIDQLSVVCSSPLETLLRLLLPPDSKV